MKSNELMGQTVIRTVNAAITSTQRARVGGGMNIKIRGVARVSAAMARFKGSIGTLPSQKKG